MDFRSTTSLPLLVAGLRWALRLTHAWLWLWSLPHRSFAWKLGSFPGFRMGLLIWIVLALSSIKFIDDPEMAGTRPYWCLLLGAVYVHTMFRWCSGRALDETRSRSWAGRTEPLVTLALMLATGFTDMSWTLMWGYLASLAQIRVARLVGWLERWTPERTDAIARGAARVASRVAGLAGAVLTSNRASAPPSPAPLPVATNGQGFVVINQPKRIGFVAWICRYLVGHMIFSMITGALGLGVLLKLASLPFAILLTVIGYEVHAPRYVKDEVESRVASASDKAREWIGRHKEELREKATEAYDEQRGNLGKKAVKLRNELKQEAREAVTDAMWHPFR